MLRNSAALCPFIVAIIQLCYDKGTPELQHTLSLIALHVSASSFRSWPVWFTLILLAMASFLNGDVVSANGRATLVSSQEKGPYRIDVSILPGQAVVANTHLSVLVISKATEQALTNATVNVSATGPAGSTDLGPKPAPNDVSPQFYETDLPFDMAGQWELKIDVSTELGEETIIVPLDVRQGGSNLNWILLAAVAVAIITVGVWTWDRVSRRRDRRAKE